MAERTVGIEIKTTADTSGAKQAQASIKELTQEEIRAAEAAGLAQKKFTDAALAKAQAGKAARAAGIDTSKLGILANQASFQIGDFATQVQMGTSAVRAFSQQAPQLIGSFSTLGLVSGPAGLALAGFAVAIPFVGMLFESLSGTTDKLSGAMKELSNTIEKDTSKALKSAFDKAEAAATAAAAAVQKWEELKAAQDEARASEIDNAQSAIGIQETINAALGIEVDLTRAKLELERQSRAEKAAQAQAVQAGKMTAAVDATGAKSEALNRVDAEIARLTTDANITARSISRMTEMIAQEAAAGNDMTAEALEKSRAEIIGKADATAKRVAELQAEAAKLNQEITVATNTANDQIAGAQQRIESIATGLEFENLNAAASEVAASIKGNAATLQATLQNIKPVTAAQETAYRELQAIASDGVIAANETAAMGANLSKLIGGVQSGVAQYNGNITELIRVVSEIVTTSKANQDEIRRINGRLSTLRN